MNRKKGDFELIAKRCPNCGSLILARLERIRNKGVRYGDHQCSYCDWKSPMNRD